jgi:gluconolactonase
MTIPITLPVERLDARFDALIPAGAVADVLADLSDVEGPHWLEGPAWDSRNHWLLFSDVKANAIYRWDPHDGLRLFMRPSGYTGPEPAPMEEPGSNGLAFDREGRLLLCEHGDRRVTRLEADGRKTVLADRYQGRRLNSPNDLVCRSTGDIYFTDPPYGLPGRFDDPSKELPFNGVFRIAPEGALALVIDSIQVPNGIGFSPDEKTLYVTDGGPQRKRWLAFPLADDGSAGTARVLFDAANLPGLGGPDGLAIDQAGTIFATGLERVFVFAPDGSHLGSIFPGSLTSNVAWGEDGSSLFITADRRLLRLRLGTRGIGF